MIEQSKEIIQIDPPDLAEPVCGEWCDDWQQCPSGDDYGYCEHIHGFTKRGEVCWN